MPGRQRAERKPRKGAHSWSPLSRGSHRPLKIEPEDWPVTTERLRQQVEFIIEIDRLKSVLRRTYLASGERRENSAEHSWQVAVMALVLAEHANEPVDPLRVARMLLLHDIVEVDAGDTFCYDEVGALDKAERERKAAQRIFGLLPPEQAAGLREIWEEFETGPSPEAKLARALDRLMPMLHNYETKGRAWQEHGITSEQVIAHNAHIADGSEALWQFASALIEDAVARGFLAD